MASQVLGAGTRWAACKHRCVSTMARVSSEAKNMASETFFKTTWHVEASGNFDYGGILWF